MYQPAIYHTLYHEAQAPHPAATFSYICRLLLAQMPDKRKMDRRYRFLEILRNLDQLEIACHFP